MIKINLLPFRAARKKENIRRQVSIFCLLILLSLAGLYFITTTIDAKIKDLQTKNAAIKQEIEAYKARANKANQLKKDLEILESKLAIVDTLKKDRKKPFELFDQLTELVIPERMWLTSLDSRPAALSLKGIAYDNPTVADFMKKIESRDSFSAVNLKNTKIKPFKDDLQLIEFDMDCIKTAENTDAEKK